MPAHPWASELGSFPWAAPPYPAHGDSVRVGMEKAHRMAAELKGRGKGLGLGSLTL